MHACNIHTHSCLRLGQHDAALGPVDALDVDGLTGTIKREQHPSVIDLSTELYMCLQN